MTGRSLSFHSASSLLGPQDLMSQLHCTCASGNGPNVIIHVVACLSLGAQGLSPLRSEILNHKKESGHFWHASIVWTGTGHQTKWVGLQDHPCLHFLKILKECECQLPLSSGKETLGGSRMLLLEPDWPQAVVPSYLLVPSGFRPHTSRELCWPICSSAYKKI